MRGLCVLAALCLLLSGCDSLPYPRMKWRDGAYDTKNRRNQK